MKAKIFTTLCFLATTLVLFAQAPQAFQYQAVVRNDSGELITNQSVSLQISILQGSAVGASEYSETHATITNTYGLVNIEIGNGTLVSGSFTDIDWASDTYYLKVEIDESGGSNYQHIGTSQLFSVPYALHAKTVESETQSLSEVLTEGNDAGNKSIVNVSQQGIGTPSPDASAALDVNSTSKGMLVPRLSFLEISSITSPADGLLVYNTDLKSFWYYDVNTSWKEILKTGQESKWQGTGNIYYTGGNVGIGTSTPSSELTIHGGSGANDAALTLDVDGTDWHVGIDDSDNDKLKIGTSSGVGTDTKMTVQSDGNVGIGTATPLSELTIYGGSGANDAALTLDVDGTDWYVGIDDSDGDKLKIGTGSGVGNNTRMTVQSDGNVGIGTATPEATLEIEGTMKVFGAWLSRSEGITYHALTDGFVVAGLKVTTTSPAHISAIGFTDNNSSPNTERGYICVRYETYGDNMMSSFTMPVRKGDYWKVEATYFYGTFDAFIYWIPLGVND